MQRKCEEVRVNGGEGSDGDTSSDSLTGSHVDQPSDNSHMAHSTSGLIENAYGSNSDSESNDRSDPSNPTSMRPTRRSEPKDGFYIF